MLAAPSPDLLSAASRARDGVDGQAITGCARGEHHVAREERGDTCLRACEGVPG
jgi:hypothetical protein